MGIRVRLECLEGRVEPPGESDAFYAARKRVISALDRLALLRVRQGVAADELVLETEEDCKAWSVFQALAKRFGNGN